MKTKVKILEKSRFLQNDEMLRTNGGIDNISYPCDDKTLYRSCSSNVYVTCGPPSSYAIYPCLSKTVCGDLGEGGGLYSSCPPVIDPCSPTYCSSSVKAYRNYP